MKQARRKIVSLVSEFSLPLLFGLAAALLLANTDAERYQRLVFQPFFSLPWCTLNFLVNEVFMVFFFGLATKEITEALLPGGTLHPLKKALNPLCATVGGVLGPIAVFFILTSLFQQSHLNRGWGIPTATDIALAWLGARLLCGEKHPAVDYLLLLAIVDDGIGLGIIAVFYGDPLHPFEGWYLLSVGLGSGLAYLLRRWGVQQWPVYIFGAGAFSWWGLHQAHLHPALALVGIVPFLPTSVRRVGLFREERSPRVSAMQSFGHQLKIFVDFGLFFFAFANAGLEFSAVAEISWIIFASLLIGKTLGISLVGIAAQKIGFSLPRGMRTAHLVVVGMLAGIGLTVALFVCGAAYTHELAYAQGPAKMGALFSVGAFVVAAITARVLGVLRRAPQDDKGTSASG